VIKTNKQWFEVAPNSLLSRPLSTFPPLATPRAAVALELAILLVQQTGISLFLLLAAAQGVVVE